MYHLLHQLHPIPVRISTRRDSASNCMYFILVTNNGRNEPVVFRRGVITPTMNHSGILPPLIALSLATYVKAQEII